MIGLASNIIDEIFGYLSLATVTTIGHVQVLVGKNQEKYSDEENYKIFIIVSSIVLTVFYIIRALFNRAKLRREKTKLEKTLNELKDKLNSLKLENQALRVDMRANEQVHKTEIDALTTTLNAKIDALQMLVDNNAKKYDDVMNILSQNEKNQQQRHIEALNTNLATNTLAKFAIDRTGTHKKKVVRKVKNTVRKYRLQ